MSKGFLDDIIEQISVKKPNSLPWIAPPNQIQSSHMPVQQQQNFQQYQTQPVYQQQPFSPVNNTFRQHNTPQQNAFVQSQYQYQNQQPQQFYDQQQPQQFFQNSGVMNQQQSQNQLQQQQQQFNFDYKQEIIQLQKNLSQLPVSQLEEAFNLLTNLVENVGATVEASRGLQGLPKANKQQNHVQQLNQSQNLQSQPQQVSRQPHHQNDLMSQVLAKRQQKEQIMQHDSFDKPKYSVKKLLTFPTVKAVERWTEALIGQTSTKIQRLTLETSEKYFWLDKNVQKVFWSNSEGQAACGSFSLANILYILVGQHSINYSKANISYSDITKLVCSQEAPIKPQISILNDKRERDVIFGLLH